MALRLQQVSARVREIKIMRTILRFVGLCGNHRPRILKRRCKYRSCFASDSRWMQDHNSYILPDKKINEYVLALVLVRVPPWEYSTLL